MTPLQKILIVEDDKDIAHLLQYNLEKNGFACSLCPTGEAAVEAIVSGVFDLAILDIMLPGIDGLEVCRRIRQDSKLKHIPVMMLTAKGEEVDRIVGFELGADDYVVKPFSPRELVLRVRAVLKRGRSFPVKEIEGLLKAGILQINIPAHRVTVHDREVTLTPMEFKFLVMLMERKGRVQSRDKILNDVWGIDAEVYTRTVDTHVRRLREKLGKAGELIETVPGVGYRFKDLDED